MLCGAKFIEGSSFGGRSLMSKRWNLTLWFLYLSFFGWLTLGILHGSGIRLNLVPFRTMEHDFRKGGWEFLVNFVGNIVATLPVGWLLPGLIGRKCNAVRVGLTAFAISLAIEVTQGLTRWRVADVDDVILNTLGGLVGYASYRLSFWVWLRFVRTARVAGLGGPLQNEAVDSERMGSPTPIPATWNEAST